MRRLLAILIVLLVSGCRTHLSLRDRTLDTAGTLADINYRQVLDNVARFVCNPGMLPSVATVSTGNVLVSDQGSFGGAGTYSPTIGAGTQIGGFPIFNMFMSPNVTRNVTENWTMVPVTDIDKLRRLRCAFQLVVNGAACSDAEDCLKTLEGFIPAEPEKLESAIPIGWFWVGCKSDVPKEACHVGQYRDTRVWVMSDGVDRMSTFSLTVMRLSISDLADPPSKTVVKKYDPEGNLLETEIMTQETDDDAPQTNKFTTSNLGGDVSQPNVRKKPLSNQMLSPKQFAVTPKQARKRPGLPAL